MPRPAILAVAVVAAALAIFAVLSLTNGSGGSALADAGERIEGQSMRIRVDMTIPVPEENAQVDFEGELISVADGSKGTMSGTYSFDGEEVPTDMRAIGDDMWFHYKTFGPLMPPGKRWVHMVETASAPEALTPAEFSRFLANADEVDEIDDAAPVDGRPTTHYKGVVDVSEVANEVGGETEERYERMFGNADIKVPVEAWIGRDGLPVRMKMNFEMGGQRFAMTADILEYGVPVAVKRPPAARTIEEAEFDRLTEGG